MRKPGLEYTAFYHFLVLVEKAQRRVRPVDLYTDLRADGYRSMYELYMAKGDERARQWLEDTLAKYVQVSLFQQAS